MSKQLQSLILTLLMIFFVACATNWNTKQWSGVQQKNFYVSSFSVSVAGMGSSQQDAMNKYTDLAANQYPIEQIASLIEKKFNIKIDSTEFIEARKSGISKSPNTEPGANLMRLDRDWKSKDYNINTNRIDIMIISNVTNGFQINDYLSIYVNNNKVNEFDNRYSPFFNSGNDVETVKHLDNLPELFKKQLDDIEQGYAAAV